MADEVYVAVTNIPFSFHAADLRAHFSAFVENKSFICFHFRHRPEKLETHARNEITSPVPNLAEGSRGTKCCVIKVLQLSHEKFINKYNDQQWTDVEGQYLSSLCQVTPINLRKHCLNLNNEKVTGQGEVDEKDLLSMPELRPPEVMPNGNVGTPTLVFLDLIQKCLLPNNIIKKLHLQFPSTNAKRIYSNVNFEYNDSCEESLHNENSRSCLNSSSFSDNSKRLSGISLDVTSSISKHDSHSPKSNIITVLKSEESADNISENNTGTVKLHETVADTSSETTFISPSPIFSSNDSLNSIKTSAVTITSPDHQKFSMPNTKPLTGKDKKKMEREERRKTRALMNEGIEERLIQIERRYHNDNDAEEWDRHEASEDDPSNQERNKERLYEEEIEQPWEKGGPGVVFYTDAMYWQAKDGDFDEQTTDDLDVDFSPYEGDGPGDKDIQDFLRIRQEKRFREGYDKTDRYSIGISKKNRPLESGSSVHMKRKPAFVGRFESHTRGIGRKLMEKQGWQDGQGLGVSGSGIKEALRGEGQKPKNKKGLGYVESEPNQYGPSVLKRARVQKKPATHLITTAHDDPSLTDPKEPLLQRNEPTQLKYRQSFLNEHLAKSSST